MSKMGVEESKVIGEVLKDLAKNTQKNYKVTLNQFLKFVNSKEGLNKEILIDDLVTEAKEDVEKTQDRIDNFYKWLQNETVEDYPLRGKTMRESSANQRAYSYLMGFFVNLDIGFQKKWRKKIPRPKREDKATKKDDVYTFYDVDEKTMTIRFNRERMQQFLANLKLRDVAITLALLSSSQDSGDLFKLNIGDIREQSGKSRIFWEGNREKTGILFKTLLSVEATKFIRKYIEQERKGAEDKAPLFIYTRKGVEHRMTGANLSSIYRASARRMGVQWQNGEHNPLRPKRMRHLFRTACDTAGISELYINAFMGHKNHQGQDYSELSNAKLELEYLRVEPFITVYGKAEESLEIKQDVKKLERRILDLNKEVDILKNKQREWGRSIKKIFGLTIEELTELEEDIPKQEPQTPQKMIKIAEEQKEKPSPKTEKKEASSFDPDLYLMTTGQE